MAQDVPQQREIHQLAMDDLSALLASHQPPCISMYMTVTPAFPAAMENPIRLRDLVRRAEDELTQRYREIEIRPLIERFDALQQGREFWNARQPGLAIFCSRDLFLPIDLPRSVPDLVVVADTFHTKPLVAELQTMDRYQVLGLTRKDVRLFEGDANSIREIPLKGVPKDIFQAYGAEVNTTHAGQTVERGSNYGTREKVAGELRTAAPGVPPTGTMSLEHFFRVIDQAIWENHSRVAQLPLILCTLEENQNPFRQISKNDYLLKEWICLDPAHVPIERIRSEAWKIMEPRYRQRVQTLIDAFQAARAKRLGSSEMMEVAEAAAQGRVHTLLVDQNKFIPAYVSPHTGQVLGPQVVGPQVNDALDQTADAVMRTGGAVLVIPPDLMPTDTGLAAIYRY